ncbi:MAG: thiamine pyrophosphate-dependent enzyme [Deltaproteobacteria bacterium]|nr:thiamine pyrophosphate-dependent enzyme [Deltaproteobacteria bacterium]
MPIKEVGKFSVSYLQILDENGNVDSALEPDLSDDRLIYAYESMVLAREADARMLKLQRQGRIGTFPPSTGEEAAVVGPGLAMTEKDWYVGCFRDLGLRLMRGGIAGAILTSITRVLKRGNVNDGAPRTLPMVVPIASHIPHATGVAYAMQYKGEKDAAVVTTFGDGATSEGDFHEAVNFAAVWDSPVVFICINNHWAISVPLSKQMKSRTVAQKPSPTIFRAYRWTATTCWPCTRRRRRRWSARGPVKARRSSRR